MKIKLVLPLVVAGLFMGTTAAYASGHLPSVSPTDLTVSPTSSA